MSKKIKWDLPELFCEIRTELVAKKDIIAEDLGDNGRSVYAKRNEICHVYDITGYAFDLQSMDIGDYFRVMNSEMGEYFYTTKQTREKKLKELLK